MKLMEKQNAFTLIELITTITFITILLFIFLRADHPYENRNRAQCMYNLHRISAGLNHWTDMNVGKYPWQTEPYDIVSNKKTIGADLYLAKNHLGPPSFLTCPDDKDRFKTNHYKAIIREPDKHLSYFFNYDALHGFSKTILAGDRNIEGRPKYILLDKINCSPIFTYPQWDGKIHNVFGVRCGNIAFTDGSVETLNSVKLAEAFSFSFVYYVTNNTIRILYP